MLDTAAIVRQTFDPNGVFPLVEERPVRSLSFVAGVILVVVVLCGTGFTASVSFSGTDYSTQSVGSVVSADLNRDGLPDMAIAGEAMISVFLATGPGKFGATVDYPVPTAPDNLRNLLAADFKGDGALST